MMNIAEYAALDATGLAALVQKKQVAPKELAQTAAAAIAKHVAARMGRVKGLIGATSPWLTPNVQSLTSEAAAPVSAGCRSPGGLDWFKLMLDSVPERSPASTAGRRQQVLMPRGLRGTARSREPPPLGTAA